MWDERLADEDEIPGDAGHPHDPRDHRQHEGDREARDEERHAGVEDGVGEELHDEICRDGCCGRAPIEGEDVEGGRRRGGGCGRSDAGEAKRCHRDDNELVAERDQAAKGIGPLVGGGGDHIDDRVQQRRREVQRAEYLLDQARSVASGVLSGHHVRIAAGGREAVGGRDIGAQLRQQRC